MVWGTPVLPCEHPQALYLESHIFQLCLSSFHTDSSLLLSLHLSVLYNET